MRMTVVVAIVVNHCEELHRIARGGGDEGTREIGTLPENDLARVRVVEAGIGYRNEKEHRKRCGEQLK